MKLAFCCHPSRKVGRDHKTACSSVLGRIFQKTIFYCSTFFFLPWRKKRSKKKSRLREIR